jgi:hypothetical protein
MTALLLASTTGWTIGWSIGIAVVLAVVALVVPILLLAGGQAADINDSLMKSVDHTASLAELNTTIEAAEAIVAGLARGRNRLGG